MALQEYRRKRDFRKSPEPGAKVARSGRKLKFVVQKHDASHLHYDFRLELDGVLKSWAVPKGPSLDPDVKSLAVEVEDHPVAYARFEGVIPAGEYGGGTVIVWDRGTWEPEEDPHAGLKKGHLKFQLHGERLKGGWHLVRLRREGSRENWLLMKQKDRFAKPGDGHGLTNREVDSIVTGRDLETVAGEADRVWTRSGEQKRPRRATTGAKSTRTSRVKGTSRSPAAKKTKNPRTASSSKKQSRPKTGRARTVRSQHRTTRAAKYPLPAMAGARPAPLPRHLSPELATLVSTVPQGDGWLHELKFDGYRILAWIDEGRVRLFTRNGNDWTDKFPTVARSLQDLPLTSAILDGELVALNERGVASFQRLQNAIRENRSEDLVYYVFDAPYLEGLDLRGARLIERKYALARILQQVEPKNDGSIRYSEHVRGQGDVVFRKACQSSLEGIVCKAADSHYESRRTRDWVKVKCHGRQEFVIAGFTKAEGERVGFGALLLGYYEQGELRYAGRVGTGFDHDLLLRLSRQLRRLASTKSPFGDPLTSAERKGVTFVRPKLVAEVEFTEWTDDGRLRHPSFQGLRTDKPAREIVRELPANGATAGSEVRPMKKMSAATRRAATRPTESDATVAGVMLTHPDRVLFPDDGVTKLDLARFYESIADRILPYIVDRPLTLVRCPDGSQGACFYQKHWTESLPDAIGSVPIKEKSATEKYVVIHDLAGLISLVQMSVLELHPWSSKVDRLEQPDQVIFDLDPGPGVAWKDVVQGAGDVRDVLSELGLTAFVRTSGGKGLHVVAPLSRRNSWEEVAQFAHDVASGLAKHAPDRYVANMRKALRKGKVFVDYLRNQRGATAVACYSTRNRAGCPVATPVDWKELDGLTSAAEYTLANLTDRLKRLRSDPWAKFATTRQTLTKAILKRAADFAGRAD